MSPPATNAISLPSGESAGWLSAGMAGREGAAVRKRTNERTMKPTIRLRVRMVFLQETRA
jgi:hypothetical protein